MKILVTGSRNWTDWATIYNSLKVYPEGTELIHGAAPGADRIAMWCGRALGFKIHGHPAKWNLYGDNAGPIRNEEMLNRHRGSITRVYAYPLPNSVGTIDMIQRAMRAGIKVHVYYQDGTWNQF